MAATDCDVIVIGAGLAGVHAALTLEGVGMRVLVLEAQQRVGGRIHSMRQLGGTAEAGGTYIGAGYARDVSALLLLFRGAFSKSQRALAPADSLGFTARHGVQRIPEAMAAALTRGVELGHEVAAISLEPTEATVACTNGRRFRASHVVAAVPTGVLRRIAIDPKLPAAQAQAVATLPSQPLTQVYLAPRSRFWEHDGYAPSLFTDTRAGMLAAARNRDNPAEVTSLTAWITGTTAAELDRLPAAEAGRAVIGAIETLRPAAQGQLELLGLHSWGADAYAAGAWAYFRPGEVTRFAAVLGVPHGRLYFCGEHLATTSRGMEGAMESAEEAAAAILEHA